MLKVLPGFFWLIANMRKVGDKWMEELLNQNKPASDNFEDYQPLKMTKKMLRARNGC